MRRVTRCLSLGLSLAVLLTTIGCSGSNTAAPSGPLTQTDLVVGTGATATSGNSVTVDYSGWLYNPASVDGKGPLFDAQSGFTFTLGAGSVIAGWDQGVVGMQVGGQRRLIIPPDKAYGSTGRTGIPPNATLLFDITLTAVQ
jgi:FKBP-type peptidyl-prolyl cis-trans isomerase FkpA